MCRTFVLLVFIVCVISFASLTFASTPAPSNSHVNEFRELDLLGDSPSLPCAICETVVVWVELHIVARKPNVTEREVLAILDFICNSTILGKYSSACTKFMLVEGDKILNQIYNGTSGQLICSTTQPPFCPSSEISRAARRYAKSAILRHMPPSELPWP